MLKEVFEIFEKLVGLWLVGEVVDYVGIYGSNAAEGWPVFQRRSFLLTGHILCQRFPKVSAPYVSNQPYIKLYIWNKPT